MSENHIETTKHTPGPWKVDADTIKTTWNTVYGHPNPICRVMLQDGIAYRDANARLIAAAPELLEACKVLENVFAATERAQAGLRDFCVTDLQNALDLARHAITKATQGSTL